MKKGLLLTLLGLALCMAAVPAMAQDEFVGGAETDKRAQTGFKFLSISPDARAAAMGDAMTAMDLGSSVAMFYNPAGMARLPGTFHAAGGRTNWIADIGYSVGSLAFRPADGAFGVFGVSVMAVDYGEFIGTVFDETASGNFLDFDEIGLDNPSPTALSIGLGYARGLTDRFAVGAQVKYAHQDFGAAPTGIDSGGYETRNYDLSTVAFDFGILYNTGFRSLNFAMSARNFSQELKYVQDNFELPLTFRIGVSMNMLDLSSMNPDMHSFIVSLDAERPRDFDENLRIGGEYKFMNLLALRAGYSFPTDEQGVNLGVGLNPQFSNLSFGFDYAYTSFGVFDAVHRLGVSFGF